MYYCYLSTTNVITYHIFLANRHLFWTEMKNKDDYLLSDLIYDSSGFTRLAVFFVILYKFKCNFIFPVWLVLNYFLKCEMIVGSQIDYCVFAYEGTHHLFPLKQ